MSDHTTPDRAVMRERFLAGWECALRYMRDIRAISGPSVSDLPMRAIHDPDRHVYFVPVSDALFPQMEADWSDLVRVKIEDGQMVMRRADA